LGAVSRSEADSGASRSRIAASSAAGLKCM
jgi:hypothetical protein